MKIKQTKKQDVVMCCITGDINIDTVYQLRDVLEEILAGKNFKILLDFEKVGYIDSLGMSTLAGFAKKCNAQGGTLALCSLSPKLGSIFHIVKLGKVFPIYETQKQALAAL